MYTVNKGPSKLVAKTRGGLTAQNIEITRKCSEPAAYDLSEMHGGPRPVFHARKPAAHHSNNGHHNHHQSYNNNNNNHHSHHQQWHPNGRDNWTIGNGSGGGGGADEEEHSPQHEELVNFIRDSWNVLATATTYELDSPTGESTCGASSSNSSSPTNGNGPVTETPRTRQVVYYEEPPSPLLKDFGAFDLESWWGRRLFNNITKSVS